MYFILFFFLVKLCYFINRYYIVLLVLCTVSVIVYYFIRKYLRLFLVMVYSLTPFAHCRLSLYVDVRVIYEQVARSR